MLNYFCFVIQMIAGAEITLLSEGLTRIGQIPYIMQMPNPDGC